MRAIRSMMPVQALSCMLDKRCEPVIVYDPCGILWETYWITRRWRHSWQAWRLAPGLTQEGDTWNVISALSGIDKETGTKALARALFPEDKYESLPRDLMACIVRFAEDTGNIADLPALASQLWAEDPWITIARWSKMYPTNPALQRARTLLTGQGASNAVLTIRNCMGTYHHPLVAETFSDTPGFDLGSLKERPAQIVFLTPDEACLRDEDLAYAYTFMIRALMAMAELHRVKISFFSYESAGK